MQGLTIADAGPGSQVRYGRSRTVFSFCLQKGKKFLRHLGGLTRTEDDLPFIAGLVDAHDATQAA